MTAVKVCREGSYADRCELDDNLLNWGQDIRVALLTNDIVARERGRIEIDSNHKNKQLLEGTIPIIDYVDPTSVVSMNEIKGKLISQSFTITANSRETVMKMEALL